MVRSYLVLLERRYGAELDDPARELIHHAADGVQRMRALLDDLLRYSHAGGQQPARGPVGVRAVLAGVLRSLEPAIADTGATVVVDGPLPTVDADAVQLGQVLQNLVANAVKFHPPGVGTHVVIRAVRHEEPGAWSLEVQDDGIGIDPGQHERIFQVFQRLQPREEYPGTGIGLAICRRIAERMGGRVELDSAPGRGSTFRLVVPDPDRPPA